MKRLLSVVLRMGMTTAFAMNIVSGDVANLALWTSVLALAAVGLFAMARKEKRAE